MKSLRSKLLSNRREQLTYERSNGMKRGQVNEPSSPRPRSTVTSTYNRSINRSLNSSCDVVETFTGVNVAVNNEEINDDEVDYDEDEEDEDDDEFAEHTIFTTASNTLQPLSSLKQSQVVYTNDSQQQQHQEHNDQDVNNLLERAARVRREFASGSSNSSLNSADAMILSLRRSTVDASSSTITNANGLSDASTATIAPGPSSSLNLRSNYARFKAGVSFDSSSDINVYHPLRRLSTLNNLKNQTGYNQSKSSSSLNYGTVIYLCINHPNNCQSCVNNCHHL